MTTTAFSDKKIERLIRISKEKPLIPAQFIPWADEPTDADIYLPEHIVSLYGHPLYDTLTAQQKRELGKHEVVQTMYSYAWSEGLATLFFNRHLLTLDTTSVEYRFLLRECIEEFQHQDMFADAVIKVGGQPVLPTAMHKFWGKLTVHIAPADCVFISVLAVELIADVYGKMLRKDPRVFSVLRKVSELHHIEEGRHIHYTQMWLQRYTENAGFLRRTLYSFLVLMNVYFMRTLYVKREIFERIGVADPAKYHRAAYRNYRKLFAQHCLAEAIAFTRGFNGFNWLTRPLWRWVLGVNG